jgi:hypothetical protein
MNNLIYNNLVNITNLQYHLITALNILLGEQLLYLLVPHCQFVDILKLKRLEIFRKGKTITNVVAQI